MQDKNVIKLTDQDAALLEQGASMLEGLENDERDRGNCSTAEGAGCSAHAVRRLASALLAHEREIGQCLHQIQEPAAAEQAAWHAGLDEGRAQAAPAAVAEYGSREERMVVLQRGHDGIPTVWCDPEIADIVGALNSGGVKTVASCSGHGEKPGGIALADGRQLLLLNSLDAFNSAISTLCPSASAPAAVAVPDAVRDAEKLLRAEAARLERIYNGYGNKWYGFSNEKAAHIEHLRVADALAATPAAAPMAKGYDSGIQTGNRVTLIFETQDAATAWFESFSDAYDTENGTRSIALPIPISTTQAAAAVDKSPELQGSMVDKTVNLQGAASAPVVLPEPDGVANLPYFSYDSDSGVEFHETEAEAIKACESALGYYREESPDGWPDEVESIKWGLVLGRSEQCDVQPVEDHPDFTETCDYVLKPYALATATGLPAQAVPAFCHVASLKLKSLQERGYLITGYALEKPVEGAQPERGFINHGGFVGWWWDGQSPQAQADARDDAELLDAMERQRIAVVPEYEGPWNAEVYNGDEKPNHRGSGSTPREAIRVAIAAAKGEGQ